MPAARQRSRSPCIACAVSATIGSRRRCRAFSRSRIACVASNPPISGICRSISTTSNGALVGRVDRRDRLAAVLDGPDVVAALLQQRGHELPVDGIVFGDEHVQRTQHGARRRARPPARVRSCRVGDAEEPRERVEQIGVLDRLGQERVDAAPAAPRRVVGRPTDVSITIGELRQVAARAGRGAPA